MVLVVNLEKIRRPALADAREMLSSYPCRKLGIVLVGEQIEHQDYYRSSKGGPAVEPARGLLATNVEAPAPRAAAAATSATNAAGES